MNKIKPKNDEYWNVWKVYPIGFPFDVNVRIDDGDGRLGRFAKIDRIRKGRDGFESRVLGRGILKRQMVKASPWALYPKYRKNGYIILAKTGSVEVDFGERWAKMGVEK